MRSLTIYRLTKLKAWEPLPKSERPTSPTSKLFCTYTLQRKYSFVCPAANIICFDQHIPIRENCILLLIICQTLYTEFTHYEHRISEIFTGRCLLDHLLAADLARHYRLAEYRHHLIGLLGLGSGLHLCLLVAGRYLAVAAEAATLMKRKEAIMLVVSS